MPSIIVILHTKSNTGYAIAPLEKTFYQMALAMAVGNESDVHFGYKNFVDGPPESLPEGFSNLIAIDERDLATHAQAGEYIRKNQIANAFCFDAQVNSAIVQLLRKSGVQKIISYWGAPMSSENSGIKLMAKRLEVFLNRRKPDHFIFESEAMQHFAVNGRGIPRHLTSVIPTGIDTEKYHPRHARPAHLTQLFGIPQSAKVVFYSGHMERRKGVHVIIDAAMSLADEFGRQDVYFIIAGNKAGEEKVFLKQLNGHDAGKRVIFAGYRTDLNEIMPCCDVGTIASTGWDSFPMSSIEMAACGLPLVVSALHGLNETIEEGVTGLKFPPGDHRIMASQILYLLNNPEVQTAFSTAARTRAISKYSNVLQQQRLNECCARIFR